MTAAGAAPAGPDTLAHVRMPAPVRLAGWEHLEARSLPRGCRTLFDGQVWRVLDVTLVCDRVQSPLQARITAARGRGLMARQRCFVVAPRALCPIHAATAP